MFSVRLPRPAPVPAPRAERLEPRRLLAEVTAGSDPERLFAFSDARVTSRVARRKLRAAPAAPPHTSNDRVSGTNHSDAIDGGPGHDTILGLIGNDKIFGSAGTDLLDVGHDDDRFFAADGEPDTVTGGAGDDEGDVDDALDVADGVEVIA